MQTFDEFKNVAGSRLVQVARGFIRQQHTGTVHQGSCQSYPLLLPAREFARPVIAAVCQAYLCEPVRCQRKSLPPANTTRQQWHCYVFLCRKLRQQIMKLPNIANLAIAEGRSLPGVEEGNVG